MMKREVEILAPAGSIESLKAAILAGADAVYIGGTQFGARAYAKNLSEEELLDAIDYVHIHGKRIYLTVNTLLKDSEMDGLYSYLLPYYKRGLDAVIVQDAGVAAYIRRYFPDLQIHASTQMTITGSRGAAFWKAQGITRVVPARELSLAEVRQIKQETGLEVECFVHGALCYCYSGQCLMSSMIGGRSGNRGQCAQPCRLPWQVKGQKPKDLMSLKDLCTIEMIPDLIDAGIDSFKIEGRMKQPEYVFVVTQMYRKYADAYLANGREKFQVTQSDLQKLQEAYQRRGYSEGYYRQHNGKNMISFQRPQPAKDREKDQGNSWLDEKIQEKINGKLILSVGQSAKLVVSAKEMQILCTGEIVQRAQSQPLSKERIEKQMRKTGNTDFLFDQLEIVLEGEVFLPMQALNELRREGLSLLSEGLLKTYRREVKVEPKKETIPESKGKAPEITMLVHTQEQLEQALLIPELSAIYVDSTVGLGMKAYRLLQSHAGSGKRFFLALPYILRKEGISFLEQEYSEALTHYDGMLIRNWESLSWLWEKGYEREIRSDQNLYVWNQYGKAFFKENGISRITAPAELNDRELLRLGITEAALPVYGYQPVMITANCIEKTTGTCRRQEGVLSIFDRYQKEFRVQKCCKYCYNVIYNLNPLYLADKQEEIRALAPAELRLDMTVETGKELQKITASCIHALRSGEKTQPFVSEFTRGHFKRGVK